MMGTEGPKPDFLPLPIGEMKIQPSLIDIFSEGDWLFHLIYMI